MVIHKRPQDDGFDEECNLKTCPTCRWTGRYTYQIPDTHTETYKEHSLLEIYDFEKGATPG